MNVLNGSHDSFPETILNCAVLLGQQFSKGLADVCHNGYWMYPPNQAPPPHHLTSTSGSFLGAFM